MDCSLDEFEFDEFEFIVAVQVLLGTQELLGAGFESGEPKSTSVDVIPGEEAI